MYFTSTLSQRGQRHENHAEFDDMHVEVDRRQNRLITNKKIILPDHKLIPTSSHCHTDSVASVCLGASSCSSVKKKENQIWSNQIKCIHNNRILVINKPCFVFLTQFMSYNLFTTSTDIEKTNIVSCHVFISCSAYATILKSSKPQMHFWWKAKGCSLPAGNTDDSLLILMYCWLLVGTMYLWTKYFDLWWKLNTFP